MLMEKINVADSKNAKSENGLSSTFSEALENYRAKRAEQEEQARNFMEPANRAHKEAIRQHGKDSEAAKNAGKAVNANEKAIEPYFGARGKAMQTLLLSPASTFEQIDIKYQVIEDEMFAEWVDEEHVAVFRDDAKRAQQNWESRANAPDLKVAARIGAGQPLEGLGYAHDATANMSKWEDPLGCNPFATLDMYGGPDEILAQASASTHMLQKIFEAGEQDEEITNMRDSITANAIAGIGTLIDLALISSDAEQARRLIRKQ